MVPWQDILQAANDNNADMIGLSGLITPSLDEMVTVAGEMQRLGLKTAAADRRRDDQQGAYRAAHRPRLRGPGHPRARRQPRGRRRSSLVSDTQREPLIAATAEDYDKLRKSRERSGQSELSSLADARANAFPSIRPGRRRRRNIPGFTISANGRSATSATSIDWTPFFRAWELAGTYPAILDDEVVGESARNLFNDAQEMLDQIIAERWVTPKATVGLWRCKREGDDILVLAGNDWTRAADAPPAGEEARRPAEHVPGRLHQSRRRGLDRRLRGRDPWARAAPRAVQGGE